MKSRMAIATFSLVVGAFALSACGMPGANKATPEPTSTPSSSVTTDTPTTTTPTPPATISTANDLVGDWQDAKVPWIVHFKDDGTYSEDYRGLKDFRIGTYEVSGAEVSLIGGDGDTDKGSIDGQTVVFRLGTLIRK